MYLHDEPIYPGDIIEVATPNGNDWQIGIILRIYKQNTFSLDHGDTTWLQIRVLHPVFPGNDVNMDLDYADQTVRWRFSERHRVRKEPTMD